MSNDTLTTTLSDGGLIDPVIFSVHVLKLLWIKIVYLRNGFNLLVVEGGPSVCGNHSLFKVSVFEVRS